MKHRLALLSLLTLAPAASAQVVALPEHLTQPPPEAEVSDSGLVSLRLVEGVGKVRPRPLDKVTVHGVGWTETGELYQSTIGRQPQTIRLNQAIPGWIEGIALMVIGERRRFWIPERLAFRRAPGKPRGMLVYDIELLNIEHPPRLAAELRQPPTEARVTPTGLRSSVLAEGAGKVNPHPFDTVEFHYRGWLPTGELWDATRQRGGPMRSKLRLLPFAGWREALQLMVVGEKRRVWVPPDLATNPAGDSPEGTIVLELELLNIETGPRPLPAPPDVAEPPVDAVKTAGGVRYKRLRKGAGTRHPTLTDMVEVHFATWTPQGEMIESSWLHETTVNVQVGGTVKGWAEGLPLMVEGERARFWVPGPLAYTDLPDRPQGDLVFEIELLRIHDGRPAGAPIDGVRQ